MSTHHSTDLARLRVPVRVVSGLACIGFIGLSHPGVIDDFRAWAQMRPPAIIEWSHYGVQRGKTTTITVDGQNLIEAMRCCSMTRASAGRS